MTTLHRLFLLASLVVGCSASAEGGSGPADDSLAHPPSRPTTYAPGSTRFYVLDRYRLGTAPRAGGAASGAAWRSFGFDLDGRATSVADSRADLGACRRRPSAPKSALADGEGGIDNNFGQYFMSVVRTLMSDVEQLTNERAAAGGYTLVLRLDDVGAGPDDAYAPGALYFVGPRDKPSFSPDETWPVVGTTGEPIARFASGYVREGTWVSGDLGAELPTIALPLLGDALVAPLYGGVFTLDLSSGEGTLAGAIRTADFVEAMRPSLMRRGVCPGTVTYDQYLQTVMDSSDLLATLPLAADPTRTCDAVSLGIGFAVKPIAGVEGVTGAPPPPKAECE